MVAETDQNHKGVSSESPAAQESPEALVSPVSPALSVPLTRQSKPPKKTWPRARPDQAGFFRRFFAFAIDAALLTLAALVLYIAYSEVRGALGGKPGLVGQFVAARRQGRIIDFSIGPESQWRKSTKEMYLVYLRAVLPEAEYNRASGMSVEELQEAFREELERPGGPISIHSRHDYEIIHELLVGYLYFILFFRLSGRTPGKRLLGLKVVDLSGRPRLTWYQAFERTHGYAASLLIGGFGFFQVLWDKGGLAMHDKLAGTTVVRQPRRPAPIPAPGRAANVLDSPAAPGL
jgi:uncharacterized RDD family membrane protein YckC